MRHTPSAAQRGSAMVITLLAMVLMTMVGMALMVQTQTETQIAANDAWAAQALYHAEAGYAEVLARVADPTNTENYMGPPEGTWVADPGWGRYLVLNDGASAEDPDFVATNQDGLDNDGDGLVDETGERYPEVQSMQLGEPIDYTWVKCRYKLDPANNVVLFGDHDNDVLTPPKYNLTRGHPVLLVTAQGAEGPARRTVEIEAVKLPFDMVKSALYAESDNFKFNGTSFMVSGVDWDPLTDTPLTGNPEAAGLLTTGNPDAVKGSLSLNQELQVEGMGMEPSVMSAPVNVDLEGLADQYRTLAEIQLLGDTYDDVTWGDYDNYTVVHVEGDLHTSGQVTGGGVLLVDGDFVCTGKFTWYGVVLVMGDVDFSGGGDGIHIYGATLIQGGGQSTIGGNSDILYSSAALDRMTRKAPYKVVNWQEISDNGGE